MLRNDQIQAALVAYLKANATIVASLVGYESSSAEIREDQWKGTEFIYPNVRVRMISNNPIDNSNDDCDIANVSVSFMVFTDYQSSLEADEIAGIISNILHKRQFTSNNLAFSLRTTNLVPAVAVDVRTWRSECLMVGIVNG